MKKSIMKIYLFLVPFLLYGITVVLFDPFNYFSSKSLMPEEIKNKTSYAANIFLWKLNEFRKSPCENILIGDSRMRNLNTKKIIRQSGKEFYNFGLSGTSPREAADVFWYCAKYVKLKSVYIGLNFNYFNKFYMKDRISYAKQIINNPLLYIVDKNVFLAIYQYLAASFTHTNVKSIDSMNVSRDEYWNYYLDVEVPRYYAKYEYPQQYEDEIIKIAEYCRKNGIDLNFIIFPTHVSAQRKIIKYHLYDSEQRFKNLLKKEAKTYDFEYENDLTTRKENYKDPVHLKDSVMDQLVPQIWGKFNKKVSGNELPEGYPYNAKNP